MPAAISRAIAAVAALGESFPSSPTMSMNVFQLMLSNFRSMTSCKAGNSGSDDFLLALALTGNGSIWGLV